MVSDPMTKTVEFCFDVGSAASYLAYTQLPKIAKAADAKIIWHPMLLGAVFKATGNSSPASVPAKGAYMGRDLARFAARYGVPFASNPDFPINTTLMMRIATSLVHDPEILQRYLDVVFTHMWALPVNLGDVAVLKAKLSAAGFDADMLVAQAEHDETKAALRTATDDAVARGVFGAPTFFIRGEMYFGQDRLDFVQAALAD
jgi:2-hydroxychromene-2-carboxylate isomerase